MTRQIAIAGQSRPRPAPSLDSLFADLIKFERSCIQELEAARAILSRRRELLAEYLGKLQVVDSGAKRTDPAGPRPDDRARPGRVPAVLARLDVCLAKLAREIEAAHSRFERLEEALSSRLAEFNPLLRAMKDSAGYLPVCCRLYLSPVKGECG